MPRPSLLLQPFKAKKQKLAPLMLHNTSLDSQPGCTLESPMGLMKMPMLGADLGSLQKNLGGRVKSGHCPAWKLPGGFRCAARVAPWSLTHLCPSLLLPSHSPLFMKSPITAQRLSAPSPPRPWCCVTDIHGACPIPWPLSASTFSSPVTSFLLDSTPDSYPQCHAWDLVTAHFQNNPFKTPMHPACKQEPGADVLPARPS